MRLIDGDNINFENTKGMGRKSLLSLLNCIDNQKTAFDAESYIEELKTKRAHCKIHKGEEYSYLAGKWEAYSDAIKIISEKVGLKEESH